MSSKKYRYSTDELFEERPSFPADIGTTEPSKRTGIIKNAHVVKIRETPSFEGKVLEIVKEGTKVDILDNGVEVNNFKKVHYRDKDKTGYISSDFCEEVRK